MRLARRFLTVTTTVSLVTALGLGYVATPAQADITDPIVSTVVRLYTGLGVTQLNTHYATFSGRTDVADSGGRSNLCQSAGSAVGGQACWGAFTINGGHSICSVTPWSGGGVGEFHDPSAGFNMTGIAMAGVQSAGAGELVGYGIHDGQLFRLQIHAHRGCAAYLALQILGLDTLEALSGVDTKPHAIDFTGDFDIQ